jgi:hypothetical protein
MDAGSTATSCINPFATTCISNRWEFCPLKDAGSIFSLTTSIVTLLLGFIIVFSFIAFPSLRHRNPPNHIFLVVVILEILANIGRILGTAWRQTNAFNASNPQSFLRLQLFIAMDFVSLAAQSVLCIVYVAMAVTCAWGIRKAQIVGAIGTILSLGISVGSQVSAVYDVRSGRLSTGNLQPWVFYVTIVPSLLVGLFSVGYIVRAVFYMWGKTKEKQTILVRLTFLLPQLVFCVLFAIGTNLRTNRRHPLEVGTIFVGIPLMGLIEALLFLVVEKIYLRVFYRCCGGGAAFGTASAATSTAGNGSLSEPLNAPGELSGSRPGITISVPSENTEPGMVVDGLTGISTPKSRRMSQRSRRGSQENRASSVRLLADSFPGPMERPRSPTPTSSSSDPLVVPSLSKVLAGMGKGELPPPTSGTSSRERSSMMLMTGNSGVGLSSPYLDEGERLLECDGSQSRVPLQ